MQPIKWDISSHVATDSLNLYVAPDVIRHGSTESFGAHLQVPAPPRPSPAQKNEPRQPDAPPKEASPPPPAPSPHQERKDVADRSAPTTEKSDRTEERNGPTAHEQKDVNSQSANTDSSSQDEENSPASKRSSQVKRSGRSRGASKSTEVPDDAATETQRTTRTVGRTKTSKASSDKNQIGEAKQKTSEATTETTEATAPVISPEDQAQLRDSTKQKSDSIFNESQSAAIAKPEVILAVAPVSTPVEDLTANIEDATGRDGKRPRSAARLDGAVGDSAAAGVSLPDEVVLDPATRQASTHNAAQLETNASRAAGIGASDSLAARDSNNSTSLSPQLRFVQHLAAKPGERAAKNSPLTDVEQARLIDRVARAVRTAEVRGGAVSLRLHPPELGPLRVELQIQDGTLSARLEAESPAARSLLVENVQILRDRLAEQGIRVDRFDVELLDRHASGDAPTFEQHAPREQGGRRTNIPTTIPVDSREPDPIRPNPRPNITGQLNVIV